MRHVVFDEETTGLQAWQEHKIIETGGVEFNGDKFHSLVCTDRPITKAVQKIHGITTEMLIGQPYTREVMIRLRQFIGKNTLATHNAFFNVGFLHWKFGRAGFVLNNDFRRTLEMGIKPLPGLPDYKVEKLIRHLGIAFPKTNRHQAAGRRLDYNSW